MKYTFQHLEHDIDRHLEKHGTQETQMVNGESFTIVRGLDAARDAVFSAYLEKKAYDAIVHYLLTAWNWDWRAENKYLEQAIEALRRDRELTKLKRLWGGIIAVQRGHFWELDAHRKTLPETDASRAAVKDAALGSMRRLRGTLTEFDDTTAVARLDEEIASLEKEERRRVTTKPDRRPMDDDLFWKIVEGASQGTAAERIERITGRLEAFGPSQIKRFQKILDDKIALAYRWDIWALAFIAQDGCSDDAFLDFRAWLVLQGQDTFEAALRDVNDVLDAIPAGLSTSAEGLRSAAAIAYEARTGQALPPRKTRVQKLRGKPWKEDELRERYPAIYRHYRGVT